MASVKEFVLRSTGWLFRHAFGYTHEAAKLAREVKCKSIFEMSPDRMEATLGHHHILVPHGILGQDTNASGINLYLSAALKASGAEVDFLRCDGAMIACELNANGRNLARGEISVHDLDKPAGKICELCSNNSRKVLGSTSQTIQNLSSFYPERSKLREIDEDIRSIPLEKISGHIYKGIEIGVHARSTALRLLRKGEIDCTQSDEVDLLKRCLIAAAIYVEMLESLFYARKYTAILTIHGVYLLHGVIVDFARREKLLPVVYGAPYRKGTLMFATNESYHLAIPKENGSSYASLELSRLEKEAVKDYMESKVLGGRENINYAKDPMLDHAVIKEALSGSRYKRIVSLYTNVVWDAQIFYQFNAFLDIYDWINSTIEFFKEKKDWLLVIRIHPAERMGALLPKIGLEEEIRELNETIPENVRIVGAENPISSYSLAEISDACLIYGTKMGVELAYRRKPVIVAGESYSRNKGFTFDAKSREHYFKLLQRIDDLVVTDEMFSKAEKFAHYWIFQRMADFPGINFDVNNQVRGRRSFNFKHKYEFLEQLKSKPVRNEFLARFMR